MVGDGGAFTICNIRLGSFKLTGLPSRSGGGEAAAIDVQLCGATTGGGCGDCLLQLLPPVCDCEDNGLTPNSSR